MFAPTVHHCSCVKMYTAILFLLVSYTTMWIVPLSIYLKVNANVCILKIFKSLLGFQEKIQVFFAKFPIIYRPLHVMLGSRSKKLTNLY